MPFASMELEGHSMKLLRWAVAGASAYAVYKYSIGKKAKGEDVLVPKEKTIAELEQGAAEAPPAPAKPKPKAKRKVATGASTRKPRTTAK